MRRLLQRTSNQTHRKDMTRRTRRLLQDDSIPDEQEQEDIITDLRDDNLAATKYFKLTIAVLCIVVTLPLAVLTNRKNLLQHVLSITSLILTAFILRYLPDETSVLTHSPLEQFAVPLNSVLVVLVLLLAYAKADADYKLQEMLLSIYIIPCLMHSLATIVRKSAARSANEIEALEKQKYVLRGA